MISLHISDTSCMRASRPLNALVLPESEHPVLSWRYETSSTILTAPQCVRWGLNRRGDLTPLDMCPAGEECVY